MRAVVGVLVVGGVAVALALHQLAGSEPLADVPARYTWTEGAERAYRVHLSSRLSARVPGRQEPQDLTQIIDGRLALQVEASAAGHIQVACQLSNLRFVASGTPDVAMTRLLSQPFAVELAADGRPGPIRYPSELDGQPRDVLREVIRTFQVVIPPDAAERWHTIEEDANGSYEADYTSTGNGRIEKRKSRYVAGAGGRRVKLLSSSIEATLVPGRAWLETVEVHEQMVVTTAEGFVVHAHLDATLVATALAGGESLEVMAARAPVSPSPPRPMVQPTAAAESRAPSAAEQRLLHDLCARLEAGDDGLWLPQAMADLLVRVPALADMVPGMIDERRIEDRTAAVLLHVLERAGTPESQEALARVLDDRQRPRMNRLRAIVALGGVAQPTEESMRRLWACFGDRSRELSVDLSNTAALAIGCLTKSLRVVDPDRYQPAKRQLLDALRAAGDAHQTQVVLKAIGNTGDPSVVDSVSPYLAAQDAGVRSAAAQSLGSMDRSDTRELLTRHLSRETDGWTRAAIAESLLRLAEPPRVTLELADRMVRSERDTGARRAMVKLLAANFEAFPSARGTLSLLLESETDETIRRCIRSSLVQ